MEMKENGKTAVDMPVKLSDGTEKQLSESWKSRTLVLVFLRHFG
jgi:hypothetical protein